jgi:hypothetical protein
MLGYYTIYSALLLFSKTALSQPEFKPDPFYSYSPNYDAMECDPSITPINGIIGIPLPLKRTDAAEKANIVVSGSVVLLNGCQVDTIIHNI